MQRQGLRELFEGVVSEPLLTQAEDALAVATRADVVAFWTRLRSEFEDDPLTPESITPRASFGAAPGLSKAAPKAGGGDWYPRAAGTNAKD